MGKLYRFTIETSRKVDRRGLGRTIYRYHIWSPDGREVLIGRWRSNRQYAQDRGEHNTALLNAPVAP